MLMNSETFSILEFFLTFIEFEPQEYCKEYSCTKESVCLTTEAFLSPPFHKVNGNLIFIAYLCVTIIDPSSMTILSIVVLSIRSISLK